MNQQITRHEMIVMDTTGHTTVTWNPEDAASVRDAKTEFDALRARGYQAFRMNVVSENGVVVEEMGERIDTFDAAAGKVLMRPHLRGG